MPQQKSTSWWDNIENFFAWILHRLGLRQAQEVQEYTKISNEKDEFMAKDDYSREDALRDLDAKTKQLQLNARQFRKNPFTYEAKTEFLVEEERLLKERDLAQDNLIKYFSPERGFKVQDRYNPNDNLGLIRQARADYSSIRIGIENITKERLQIMARLNDRTIIYRPEDFDRMHIRLSELNKELTHLNRKKEIFQQNIREYMAINNVSDTGDTHHNLMKIAYQEHLRDLSPFTIQNISREIREYDPQRSDASETEKNLSGSGNAAVDSTEFAQSSSSNHEAISDEAKQRVSQAEMERPKEETDSSGTADRSVEPQSPCNWGSMVFRDDLPDADLLPKELVFEPEAEWERKLHAKEFNPHKARTIPSIEGAFIDSHSEKMLVQLREQLEPDGGEIDPSLTLSVDKAHNLLQELDKEIELDPLEDQFFRK